MEDAQPLSSRHLNQYQTGRPTIHPALLKPTATSGCSGFVHQPQAKRMARSATVARSVGSGSPIPNCSELLQAVHSASKFLVTPPVVFGFSGRRCVARLFLEYLRAPFSKQQLGDEFNVTQNASSAVFIDELSVAINDADQVMVVWRQDATQFRSRTVSANLSLSSIRNVPA